MLTKADKQFLKENFTTKDDLERFATKDDLKDLRSQLNDDMDGKFTHQKEEIVKEVSEYIADTIVPMFETRDKQIDRIGKKVGITPIVD